MKLKLKEPIGHLKFIEKIKQKLNFKKEFVFKKERGENILFLGTIGSAKSESMLSFFYELLDNNIIDKSIHFNGRDRFFDNKFIKVINNYNDLKINCFDVLEEKGKDSYLNLNFKNKKIINIINNCNYTIFNIPCYATFNKSYREQMFAPMISYLINLPTNKENKEIPIFFEDLSSLDYEHFFIFKRVLKILNKKGYFAVCGIEDYQPSLTEEELIKNLENNFQHAFVMKLEIFGQDYLINYFKKFNFKKEVTKLIPGEYFYLYNFNVTSRKSRFFSYNLNKNMKKLDNYKNILKEDIDKKINEEKIKQF